MQYARSKNLAAQPDLLQPALMASRLGLQSMTRATSAGTQAAATDTFSEISLNGTPRHCLQWLAPVLRELSQSNMPGWLSLVDPPLPVSQKWLRAAGLDPKRILIIRSKQGMSSELLCREILELGQSHTVVSWLTLCKAAQKRLMHSAYLGHCDSLNVRMDTLAS